MSKRRKLPTWSYSHSWTQPYNASMNPAYHSKPWVYTNAVKMRGIDKVLAGMESFPEIEKILKDLKKDK